MTESPWVATTLRIRPKDARLGAAPTRRLNFCAMAASRSTEMRELLVILFVVLVVIGIRFYSRRQG
ncbi:MAG: hypothetical protein JWL65_7722 [Gammaproteobacteria bacterium]|nr:hypothetical protein [Gammaproteobacteria bacterium]